MPRKAVPTELKILRGNPGKRAINKNEPKPEILEEYPVPELLKKIKPKERSDIAIKEWNHLTGILKKQKVLTEADILALEGLCYEYAKYYYYAVHEEVQVQTSAKGYQALHPFVYQSDKSFEVVRKLLADFGLTPASRTKLGGMEEKEKDTFMDYLKRSKKATNE